MTWMIRKVGSKSAIQSYLKSVTLGIQKAERAQFESIRELIFKELESFNEKSDEEGSTTYVRLSVDGNVSEDENVRSASFSIEPMTVCTSW